MIRIVSRREGFRRCGVAHSVAPTDYPDERFTADELERLLDEPMLVVLVLDDADDEMRFGPMANAQNITGSNLVGADSSAIDSKTAIDESAQDELLKSDQKGETIEGVIETRPDDSVAGEQIQSASGDFDPEPEAKPARKPAK